MELRNCVTCDSWAQFVNLRRRWCWIKISLNFITKKGIFWTTTINTILLNCKLNFVLKKIIFTRNFNENLQSSVTEKRTLRIKAVGKLLRKNILERLNFFKDRHPAKFSIKPGNNCKKPARNFDTLHKKLETFIASISMYLEEKKIVTKKFNHSCAPQVPIKKRCAGPHLISQPWSWFSYKWIGCRFWSQPFFLIDTIWPTLNQIATS